jgi:prevent-host-death family protein
MCYMEHVTIRQLRNDVSRIVRRASAGERLIITSNGVPMAEIRPLERSSSQQAIAELIEAGRLNPPRSTAPPRRARPIEFGGTRSSEEILDELREDRL